MHELRRVLRGRSNLSRPATLLSVLLLAACSGFQSALEPVGDNASNVAWLFWIFTGVCVAVWLAVVVTLIAAVARRRKSTAQPKDMDPARERRMGVTVGVAIGATVLTLIIL